MGLAAGQSYLTAGDSTLNLPAPISLSFFHPSSIPTSLITLILARLSSVIVLSPDNSFLLSSHLSDSVLRFHHCLLLQEPEPQYDCWLFRELKALDLGQAASRAVDINK